MSSSGAALRASFKASARVKPEDIARTIVSRQLPAALDRYLHGVTSHVAHPSRSILIVDHPRALAIWMSAARSVYRRMESSLISRNLAAVRLCL